MTILEELAKAGNKAAALSLAAQQQEQQQSRSPSVTSPTAAGVALSATASRSNSSSNNSSSSPSATSSQQQAAAAANSFLQSQLSMMSSIADRYITPDYLTPLPPTPADKAGKSPLQLLAQTCSQIGADPGGSKLLQEKAGHPPSTASASVNVNNNNTIKENGTSAVSSNGNNNPSSDNSNRKTKSNSSPALIVSDTHISRTSPSSNNKAVSFKPYETSAGSSSVSPRDKSSPGSKSVTSVSPHHHRNSSSSQTPKNKTPSPATTTSSSSSTHDAGSNPVIRSGMEVLASAAGKGDLNPYRLPGIMDPAASHPAFRPPFGHPGAFGHHGAGAFAAAAAAASSAAPGSLAASLAALSACSSAAAGVCRDPYCRDQGCPTAVYNAHLAASLAGIPGMPSSYAELMAQSQKYAASLFPSPPAAATTATSANHQAPANSSASTSSNKTSSSSSSSGSTGGGGSGPYICNWMNGRDGYCGKRHNSADELLQHLRTHTNLTTSDSAAANAIAQAAAVAAASASQPPAAAPPTTTNQNSLYANSLLANLHRSYGSNRYHPYASAAKPSQALPPTLGLGFPPPHAPGAVPPPPPPSALASLASAYSPAALYALYGSRLGSGIGLP